MPLTGSYTTAYSASAFANAYLKIRRINIDDILESANAVSEIYENQSAYDSGLQPIVPSFYIDAENSQELLSNNYTWDGTTTVVCSQADPVDLSVGDWIKNKSGCLYFEISGISGTSITILNPDSLNIPNTSGSAKPAYRSENPLFFKYFCEYKLSLNTINPVYQAEEYLLNEQPDFSGYTRV